jgi:hypothetical protein
VSAVERILRAERLAIAAAGVTLYIALGGSLLLLLPLLLAIDLSMIGYAVSPRVGAVTYNAAHNLVIALAVLGVGWWMGLIWVQLLGAVWIAHVGVDRALGYGLKLPSDFRDTHLGRIGRREG